MEIDNILIDGVSYEVECEIELEKYEAPTLYSPGCGGASVRLISAKVESTGEPVTDIEMLEFIERCLDMEANERYVEKFMGGF